MSKPFTVTLEELPSGLSRATVRHRGTTFSYKEGKDQKDTLIQAMEEGAGGHQLSDGSFDLTYIEFNKKAKEVYDL